MSSTNLGWLFYNDYFKGIDYSNLDNPNNEKIINAKIDNLLNESFTSTEEENLGNSQFEATTTYPGLLLGSGNTHELPDIKGQAILGFHFDYTSGLPVIQGSSVKGVLRSAFKHYEYIQELLDGHSDLDSESNIKTLETEIFDNGDIFFDVIISKAGGKILGDDYITPHGDALKDPIPLRFLKVLPNITFKFDFELRDGILLKDEKLLLFAQILSDIGIGAKTNVGYGKFDDSLLDLISKLKNSIKLNHYGLKVHRFFFGLEVRATPIRVSLHQYLCLMDFDDAQGIRPPYLVLHSLYSRHHTLLPKSVFPNTVLTVL